MLFRWILAFAFLCLFVNGQYDQAETTFVTVLEEPFAMLKGKCANESTRDSECAGNERFEGYCIDLINMLAEKLDIDRYRIVLSSDRKYGRHQSDGSWTGLIGDLIERRADIAVAPLTLTDQRAKAVDMSFAFMDTGRSIMIKKPDRAENTGAFFFLRPFTTCGWLAILLSYIVVCLVIYLIKRFVPQPPSHIRHVSERNIFWKILAGPWYEGAVCKTRSLSGRIATAVWWTFALIVFACYVAAMVHVLTSSNSVSRPPISSFEDLSKQSTIKYGVINGGSTLRFFQQSNMAMLRNMYDQMVSNPSVFVSNTQEGVERVRQSQGRYAFILEDVFNRYMSTRPPCDTMVIDDVISSNSYTIATPIRSRYSDPINLELLRLKEQGELKKLENKWWYDRSQCETSQADDTPFWNLDVWRLCGLFCLLAIGLLVSILVAVVEAIVIRRRTSSQSTSPHLPITDHEHDVNGAAQKLI